jgi:uncharacterized protein (TIGR03435 family)
VDETGLEGMYRWVTNPPPVTPGLSAIDRMHESYEAMLTDAGLKLETRRVSKETIVVDSVAKMPTEN